MYSASNRPYLNQFTFLVSFELVPDEPLSSVRPLLPGHLQFPRGWPHTTGDTESWGRDLLPRKWEVKSFKYRVTPFHFNLQSECLSKGGGFTGVFHWVITYNSRASLERKAGVGEKKNLTSKYYTIQLLFDSNLTFPLAFTLVRAPSEFALIICMTKVWQNSLALNIQIEDFRQVRVTDRLKPETWKCCKALWQLNLSFLFALVSRSGYLTPPSTSPTLFYLTRRLRKMDATISKNL